MKGRYPTKKDTIELMMIHSLANQLKVNPSSFDPIRLENVNGGIKGRKYGAAN
jgi:hypothetical protein